MPKELKGIISKQIKDTVRNDFSPNNDINKKADVMKGNLIEILELKCIMIKRKI